MMSDTRRQQLYVVNAVVAWAGIALNVVLSALGLYGDTNRPETQTLYGWSYPDGIAGALNRLGDTLSYFTIWSNLVVAVIVTLLALNPRRDGTWMRIVRLDALLMITVTAIVYAVVVAPAITNTGLEHISNPLVHIVTPLVTLGVWVAAGPRDWISTRIVFVSLLIPVIWIVFMLIRGEVSGVYPYGFCDVATLGYPQVFLNLVLVVVFTLFLATIFAGVEKLLRGRKTFRGLHQD